MGKDFKPADSGRGGGGGGGFRGGAGGGSRGGGDRGGRGGGKKAVVIPHRLSGVYLAKG